MAVVLTKAQRKGNKLIARHRMSLLRGGSRSGKTFLLCRAVATRAIRAPGTNHCIFRLRRNAIKGTVWKTLKDVMAKCYPGVPYKESISDLTITLANGSVIMAAGLDDADRVDKILGMEFSTCYFNEATQIPWSSVEVALSRLAEKSALKLRAYFDCNPTTKLHWTYHLFVKKMKPGTREPWDDPAELAEMKINPDDNRENIAPEYFSVLDRMSTAKRKRFRDGEWSEDTEGALWTVEGLDASRVAMGRVPDLVRIVVAVDPSGTAGGSEATNDDVGIVVAGLGVDGRYYVLADRSCNLSPKGWGQRAIDAYREWDADRIVAEVNFGGDMVRHVIHSIDAKIPFKAVKASRGKIARAEPISALYEAPEGEPFGKVSHVGTHPDLEDQMCLVAGTLIQTDCGFVPIENITTQHRVMTRNGFAPIVWAGQTGHASELVEIECGGSKIAATKGHPVFSVSARKFVPAMNVSPLESLLVSPNWAATACQLRGAGNGITGRQAATTGARAGSSCTGSSGKPTTEQSRSGTTFTTRMATRQTTLRAILSRLLAGSILQSMSRMELHCFETFQSLESAMSAVRKLRRSATLQPSIAQTNALNAPAAPENQGRSIAIVAPNVARQAQLRALASSAHGLVKPCTATRPIASAEVPVYNLRVADGHLPEFFANGILVHNCAMTSKGFIGEGSPDRADALVWAITELSGKTRKEPGVRRL